MVQQRSGAVVQWCTTPQVSAEDTTLLQQDASTINQSSYTFDDWGKL